MSSIYYRLLAPLLSILVLGAALAWWLATDRVADALRARLDDQLRRAVALISDGRLPLSENLLQRLGDLLDARIGVVGPCAGNSAATPDDPTLRQAMSDLCRRPRGPETFSAGIQLGGEPHLGVLAPLLADPGQGRGNRSVLAVTSLSEVQAASRRIAAQLAAIAACGVLGLAWVAHLIGRGITRPIGDLVGLADRLADGDDHARAEVRGPREVRTLAQAFNGMADRLRQYRSQMAEKNRLAVLGELSARLAHEIRNPLTAIKLNVQLLGEASSDPLERRRVERVTGEIRRLELVVEAALSLGRSTQCAPVEQDLNPVVEELALLLKPHLAHRGIDLECQLVPLPPIRLDAGRIKQLLLNLVQNAADALPDGGLVHIGTSPASDGGAILIVEDSGPGVDDNLRDSLFQRAVSAKPGGLGIGLLVSREIAEQHSGTIQVDRSEALGGARFTVALPPCCTGATTGDTSGPHG